MSYLVFESKDSSGRGKTKVWSVLNKADAYLGSVRWKATWRRYAYCSTYDEVFFDSNCLRELADFCEAQTKEHKPCITSEI